MTDIVQAPWTNETVLSLIWRQTGTINVGWTDQSPPAHPYTCPRDHGVLTNPEEVNAALEELKGHTTVQGVLASGRKALDAVHRVGHNLLMPTWRGWVCPHEVCNYTQDWALAIDVEWGKQHITLEDI